MNLWPLKKYNLDGHIVNHMFHIFLCMLRMNIIAKLLHVNKNKGVADYGLLSKAYLIIHTYIHTKYQQPSRK